MRKKTHSPAANTGPRPAGSPTDFVIAATGLKKHFTIGGGIIASLLGRPARVVKAVDGVDIAIRRGEVFGLVGESGSGKSTLGMTLVRVHRPTSGTIRFRGEEVTNAKGKALKAYRRHAQVIFQDPYGSLNPRLTVAQLVEEPLKIHGLRDQGERAMRVIEALERVLMPPADYLHRFPHELSGGQRQRIAIARAIVLEPQFIVADEPVSMLDVSVQAGILELLKRLSDELGLAVLYVSHDIATVRYICNRVAVMHYGRFVEHGDVRKVTARPAHPYTKRLMAAVPSVDPTTKRKRVTLSEEEVPGEEALQAERQWVEIEADHFVASTP
ncbi:MAG TPA: ATP-binding cassette domain-containing protein [Xanthobacteraceae bacterium]|nr:ATP-binding cassette domain-containing protein [Xanthobacteraceae bacterium]